MNINHGSVIAYIVQIDERRVFPGEITWEDGIITRLRELDKQQSASTYLLPGFIDAHVHIESSMLTPAEFARIACRHGTGWPRFPIPMKLPISWDLKASSL